MVVDFVPVRVLSGEICNFSQGLDLYLDQGYGRKCELPRLGLALRKPPRASPPCISKPRFHKWGDKGLCQRIKTSIQKAALISVYLYFRTNQNSVLSIRQLPNPENQACTKSSYWIQSGPAEISSRRSLSHP